MLVEEMTWMILRGMSLMFGLGSRSSSIKSDSQGEIATPGMRLVLFIVLLFAGIQQGLLQFQNILESEEHDDYFVVEALSDN